MISSQAKEEIARLKKECAECYVLSRSCNNCDNGDKYILKAIKLKEKIITLQLEYGLTD